MSRWCMRSGVRASIASRRHTDHDDVIKCKHFLRYWPFVKGIHLSPANPPHKGQWRGALVLSLICAWIHGWVNNREDGDLRRHRAHYDVTVMNMITWANTRSQDSVADVGGLMPGHLQQSYQLMITWWQFLNANRMRTVISASPVTVHVYEKIIYSYSYSYMYIVIPSLNVVDSDGLHGAMVTPVSSVFILTLIPELLFEYWQICMVYTSDMQMPGHSATFIL